MSLFTCWGGGSPKTGPSLALEEKATFKTDMNALKPEETPKKCHTGKRPPQSVQDAYAKIDEGAMKDDGKTLMEDSSSDDEVNTPSPSGELNAADFGEELSAPQAITPV